MLVDKKFDYYIYIYIHTHIYISYIYTKENCYYENVFIGCP